MNNQSIYEGFDDQRPTSNLVKRYGSCSLTYHNDAYPGTAKWARAQTGAITPSDADSIPAISKWFDREYIGGPAGYGCRWQLTQFAARQPQREYGSMQRSLPCFLEACSCRYLAEHVYERHMISTFLNWLQFEPADSVGSVSNCAAINRIFGNPSGIPGSTLQNISPIQKLGQELSCFAPLSCVDNTRVTEFFILNSGVNVIKTFVRKSVMSDLEDHLLISNRYLAMLKIRLPFQTTDQGGKRFGHG